MAATVFVLSMLSAASALAQEAHEQPEQSQADEQMQNGGVTEERDLSDEQARIHFRAGRGLYDAGRFQQAAEEFEMAYRLSQRPELLFNAYVAFRDANNLEGAVRSLGAYLDQVEEVPDRVNLEARLRSMSLALDDQRTREAELERERNRPAATTQPPGDQSVVWPWIMMGAGGAAVIAGVVTGIVALNDADALVSECPNDFCQDPSIALDDRRSAIHSLGITTDVLLFAGGAIAVTGLILGIVLNSGGSSAPEQPQVSAMCGPTGCAATLRARF